VRETEKRNLTMAMFRTSPEKTLQTAINEARVNRDRLAARVFESETSVTARRGEALQLAYDNAEGAVLARAQTALQAALGDVATFGGALTKASALLAKLEGEHAELIDKALRKKTASEVAEMATDLEATSFEVLAVLERMSTLTGRLARFNPDAAGLNAFSVSSGMQIGPAVELVATVTRLYARQVLDGTAPAALPQAEPAAVKAVQAAPPATRHVFSVRHISWTDPAGLRVQAGGFECDLPPAVAARGLKSGAVALIGSEAWRTLKGTRPITHPAPERCLNLDGDDGGVAEPKAQPQPQHEVVRHSAFEVIDRGPPRQMRIVAGGAS
jgi:hypothetical protein